MSDRLHELLRQRALMQEHLAWLDREIAASSENRPATQPRPSPVPTPIASSTISSSIPVKDESEEILRSYHQNPGSIQDDVRRGCFRYFFGALAALAAIVMIAYVIYRKKHPDDNSRKVPIESYQASPSPASLQK